MKEIKCEQCGEIIENGYAINPQVTNLCAACYDEIYDTSVNDLNDDFASGIGEI